MSIYNAFEIPFEFSFGISYDFMFICWLIDYTLDCIFLFDSILMFFTSYLDNRGSEIRDHYQICLKYFGSYRFIFDILSLFGSFHISSYHHKTMRFLLLFKATRIYRINQLVRKSKRPKKVKILMSIAELILYLFLYIHWIASFWNIVI